MDLGGPGKGPGGLRPFLKAAKGLALHKDQVGLQARLFRTFLDSLKSFPCLGIISLSKEKEGLVKLLLRRGPGLRVGVRSEGPKQEEEAGEEKDR